MMALVFEVTFAGEDWANYGFRVVRDGLQNVEGSRNARMDIDWLPASHWPTYYGFDLGQQTITVTGVVSASTRANLISRINSIKATLLTSLAADGAQQLYFGDQLNKYYMATYNGSFAVKYIGSCLGSVAALVTVGFTIFAERV